MMNIKATVNFVVAGVFLLGAHQACASTINVFLDNGAAPGSSNSGAPYAINASDSTWDVLASAESGLSAIGAAVMEVRMVTFNINGDLRGAGHNGFGLGVQTGGNGGWFDGSTQEAALFQLSFYSDAGKTTEITGVDITFESLLARQVPHDANRSVTAYAGSGALTIDGSNNVFLAGSEMTSANDSINHFAAQVGLGAADSVNGQYVTTLADGTTIFDEDDSFWLRRRNLAGAADAAYQLGAVTFDVTAIPEPATLGLLSMVGCGLLSVRRRLTS